MVGNIETIVTGVADPEIDDPQLAWSIALAERVGAVLHVVHSYPLPDATLYPYLEMTIFSPEAMEEIRMRRLEQLENRVSGISRSTRIHCHIRPLSAGHAILDVAEEVEADLIIMGATHRGKLARAVLGTTAQRVVRHAPMPVLVNAEHGAGLKRVLMATDTSDHSRRMHRTGIELAARLASDGEPELRAVAVVDHDLPVLMPLDPARVTESAARHLDAYLAEVRNSVDRPIEGTARMGEPAREILAEAATWKADLIVMGTHGRTGATRFLIGSVAEAVLERAECAVLVVPSAAVAVVD